MIVLGVPVRLPIGALAALCCLAFAAFHVPDASALDALTRRGRVMEAVLKIDRPAGMLDLYLTDIATGRRITDAKVNALLTPPSGRKVRKELPGMKMGDDYSYMVQMDLGEKGVYSIEIGVERGGEKEVFSFTHGR